MNASGPYIAEIPRRGIAVFIDYFLFSFFYALFLIKFGETETVNGRLEYYLDWPIKAVPFVVWVLTFPVLESFEGKTVGKRIMKLQVVRLDGGTFTLLDSLKRRLLDWIDFAFLGLPSIISSQNSPTRQRFGDRFAKTTVIDTREIVA